MRMLIWGLRGLYGTDTADLESNPFGFKPQGCQF